jgi:hypothetical protein
MVGFDWLIVDNRTEWSGLYSQGGIGWADVQVGIALV